MNVQEKIKKMENKRGKNHDLVLFREWLDEYLPKHKNLKKIQVAGTNGKGSTCKWLSMFLQSEGYKTGMFTSPHLVSHMERIQIDSKDIPLEDWERIYDTWNVFFEENQLTMFEIDLWMALVYFIEQNVDVAIIEVGLGGRLDATTSLDYMATLITNVGLDHQEILGETLEQIAYEKSGIFKSNAIALTTEKNPACQKVMELVADYLNVMLGFVSLSNVTKTKEGYKVVYNGVEYVAKIPEYQIDNMILALETLFVLGYSISSEHIQETLNNFNWLGRFSVIRQHPYVLVDGAHNVPGIKSLVSSLHKFDGKIYFSVLKEKDAPEMIEELKKLTEDIVLVRFETDRLYPLENLGLPIVEFNDLEKIIKNTKENLLLCGSLYFVGDVLKIKI